MHVQSLKLSKTLPFTINITITIDGILVPWVLLKIMNKQNSRVLEKFKNLNSRILETFSNFN